MLKKVGFVLVLLMALLQAFYALFAFLDPVSFSNVRGTSLVSLEDTDWVQIYASRTLFVALIVGFLLYLRNYKILSAAALFGVVMPVTDAWLAFQADAPSSVVIKHLITIVYLLCTAWVLYKIVREEEMIASPSPN
ncbi:DUF4267 domain-containing protein [Litoribacillus peritrichatus]|uniref:DUF4267 domain-containing protein n=1 Tax=Litoribacillus peritrichatus TaxID=718191 RepID=A0ABP7N615_9GAMM